MLFSVRRRAVPMFMLISPLGPRTSHLGLVMVCVMILLMHRRVPSSVHVFSHLGLVVARCHVHDTFVFGDGIFLRLRRLLTRLLF